MTSADFVLELVDAWGGSIQGRTLLQKRAYFVWLLSEVDVDLGFDAHYYGPFSATLENATSQLKTLGFIDEANVGFGVVSGRFEVKRYDYRLTEDGKEVAALLRDVSQDECDRISAAVERIKVAGDPNYFELSIAAKAYFIVKKLHKSMSKAELIREAAKFDWNIQANSLEKAIDFLQKLQLVKAN